MLRDEGNGRADEDTPNALTILVDLSEHLKPSGRVVGVCAPYPAPSRDG